MKPSIFSFQQLNIVLFFISIERRIFKSSVDGRMNDVNDINDIMNNNKTLSYYLNNLTFLLK